MSEPRSLLDRYCGLEQVVDGRRYTIETKRVMIEEGLLPHVASLVEDYVGPADKPLLLICDRTTWRVAGEAVVEGFAQRDRALDRLFIIEPDDGAAVADDEAVDHAQQALAAGSYSGVIAVGSGTVNDIAKLASHRAGLPYACVATAPSMNGYTSGIAAILSHGVKTTTPCRVPQAVFFDLQVNAHAPYRMVASGLGDLLSRPVSNADWRLSARLAQGNYSRFAVEMIEASGAALVGVAPKLPTHDLEAMRGLCLSLALSGMAMAAVGNSAPASGGEHLISHYLDMVTIASGEPHDLHGCQVGVGTITTAALYERLRAMEPEEVDIERLVSRHLPWSVYAQTIRHRFERFELTDAVLEHARNGYPTRDALRARLATLVEDWDDILHDVSRTLRTAAEIRQTLQEAQGPCTYEAIGVSPERARDAILHCKDIRARYTILHLAAELDTLTDWTTDLLQPSQGLLR
jgi:glycerol-1-phosphate dehydrogenase [NAD(P)+]